MNKLKELKEAIIKANPEIVELKFGCIVEIECKKETVVGRMFRELNGGIDLISTSGVAYTTNPKNKKTPQLTKIIGRPITLADVLIALELIEPPPYMAGANIALKWDKHKNSLDNQADITISTLHKLLVGKDE